MKDKSNSRIPKKLNPKLNKFLLILSPIMLSLLIASFVTSITFVYDDLTKLYFDTNLLNKENSDDLFSSLIKNIIFVIVFLVLIILGLKKFLKFTQQTYANKEEIKKTLIRIIHNKQFLFNTIFASVMITMAIVSLFFAQGIVSELNEIGWTSEKITEAQKSLLVNLISELFFGVFFIWWGTSMLSFTFRKISEYEKPIETEKSEASSILEDKKSKLTRIKNKLLQNPTYKIFLYVILLPFIFSMLILFNSYVLKSINSIFETPIASFGNYVLYLLMIFIAIVNNRYVQTFKKINVQKHFEILGSKYIVKERRILEKIHQASVILMIISSIVLIAYIVINPQSNNTNTDKVDPIALFFFSVLFGVFLIFAITSVKMRVDHSKELFRSWIAMGFFKAGLDSKDKIIDYLDYGLQSYSNFFKQYHKQRIENIQQIVIEIISKEEHEKIKIIQNMITAFKSTNTYDALNEICKLMNVKSHEILTSNKFILKIKDWGTLIVSVIVLTLTIMWYWKSGLFS